MVDRIVRDDEIWERLDGGEEEPEIQVVLDKQPYEYYNQFWCC